MPNRRTLGFLILLIVAGVFYWGESRAAPETDTLAPPEELFQLYSEAYFFQRSVDFAKEMSLREFFLKWLFEGINQEVNERRRQNVPDLLDIVSPPELENLSASTYAIPDDIEDATTSELYMLWENHRSAEFNHKFLQARITKDRLIQTGTTEQQQRMFDWDLSSAVQSYALGQFREAILQIDELAAKYNRELPADLYFYRAEAYFALQLYNLAYTDYSAALKAIEPGRGTHKLTLERLIAISGSQSLAADLTTYWESYDNQYGDNAEDGFWTTAELAARYFILADECERARTLLDRIPLSWADYPQAKLRAAECSVTLLDVEDAEERLVKLVAQTIDGVVIPPRVRETARLKLGYIDFLLGDFDLAYRNFNKVAEFPDLIEEAAISKAWALYRLGVYEKVQELCTKFLTDYPNSEYHYECLCLIGYTQELLGTDAKAVQDYQTVMSAIDDRQEYRGFNYERNALDDLVDQIRLMEEPMFAQGRSALFPEYLKLRQQLVHLSQLVRLSESLKSAPKLKEILEEQKNYFDLYNSYMQMDELFSQTEDLKLNDQYEKKLDIVLDHATMIQQAVRYEMSKQSLIQREERQRFDVLMRDSLKTQLESELEANTRIYAKTKSLLDQTAGVDDPILLLQLTNTFMDLTQQQEVLLKVQEGLSGQKVEPPVASHLDEWSDFAYARYTYKGIDFDRYYTLQQRARELDSYIQKTNLIISLRSRQRSDTSTLADNLRPSHLQEKTPYAAPPAPLWEASKLPYEAVDKAWYGISGSPPPPSSSPEKTVSPEEKNPSSPPAEGNSNPATTPPKPEEGTSTSPAPSSSSSPEAGKNQEPKQP